MQYVIYFAVAAPLLLGWLFWEAEHTPPQPPLFASGLERLSPQPVRNVAGARRAPAGQAARKLAKNEASPTD